MRVRRLCSSVEHDMINKRIWSVFYRKPIHRKRLRCFKQMTDNTKVSRSSTMSVETMEAKLLQLAKVAKKGAQNG